MLREFRDFIAKGNLVQIAVAFILGVAFGAVVLAFTDVVLSFIAAIFGSDVSFDDLTWALNKTPIPYGTFLTAVVNFLIIAWILFPVVKAYNGMQKTPDPTTKVCDDCRSEIRPRVPGRSSVSTGSWATRCSRRSALPFRADADSSAQPLGDPVRLVS